MSYANAAFGPSDGFNVVMSVLHDFAVSTCGWTSNYNTFPYLSISKGDCFANFFFDESQTVDDTENTGSNVAPDYRIRGCLASSFSSISPAANQFLQQPGSLPHFYDVTNPEDQSLMNSNDWTGPYSQYWLFSGADGDPDYIYMIVQKANGRFCYVGFGNVDKKGSTFTPGGGFMDGIYWNWWFRNGASPTPQFNVGSGAGSDSQSGNHSWIGQSNGNHQVYLGSLKSTTPPMGASDGQTGGRGNHYSIAPLMAQSSQYDPVNGLLSVMSVNTALWLHPIFYLGPNPINGSSPLFEIPLFQQADAGVQRLFFFGSLPGRRYISMINRLEAEELAFGSDNWLVFPFKRALPWVPEPFSTKTITSGPYGHAFKINS